MKVKDVIGPIVTTTVVLSLVMMIGVFGFGWFQKETAEFRGDVRETERLVADPEYRRAIYDQFFELCTGVENAEAGIEAQTGELDRATDPARRAQLESNLSALATQRASLINQYNNKAGATTRTQARYFPPELPTRLDAGDEETTCVA